nr:hypothetical protein [Tanacetum cinerariifolium]
SGSECGPPAETMSLQRTKLTPVTLEEQKPIFSSTSIEEQIRRERKIQRYYEADNKRKKEYGKIVAAYNKERFVNDSHALICPTALGTHLPNMRKINAKAKKVELDGKLKGICMQKGGRQPTSMVSPMAKAGGFTFVSDMIHAKGIVVATECTDSLGLISGVWDCFYIAVVYFCVEIVDGGEYVFI